MPKGIRMTEEGFKDLLLQVKPNLKLISTFSRMEDRVKVVDELGIIYENSCRELVRNKTLTIESAIDKNDAFAKKCKFLNFPYDYSKVNYQNARKHVILVCPEHGDFDIVPDCHLNRGHGCGICARIKSEETRAKQPSKFWDLQKWIEASKKGKRFESFKFYIVRCWNENESFYKIGRTFNKLKYRFQSKTTIKYKWEPILVKEGSAEWCFNTESEVKEKIIEKAYRPLIHFSGVSECFEDGDYINEIINEINEVRDNSQSIASVKCIY